jgi:hypothetical protein
MTTANLCRSAALSVLLVAFCPAAETDHLANVPMAFSAPASPGAPLRYVARGRNHAIELNATGADLVFENATLSLRVRGANPNSTPTPERRLPGTANYFTTQDKSKWQHNLPTYAAIRYPNVLPGIDLVYYGQGKQLEYDFVLAPGADPDQIEMQVSQGWKRRLTADGDLEISTAGGTVRFAKPVSYQLSPDGSRQPVKSAYQTRAANRFGFRIGNYDRTRPLIIDPVFIFGTYLGGNVSDIARAVAVDSARNVWVAGRTLSVSFPVTNGSSCQGGPLGQPCGFGSTTPNIAPWGFVTKFDPTGTRVLFSTYLGGINVNSESGDGTDNGGTTINALTLDQAGNVYLAGRTASPAYPTTADALQPLRARKRVSTWPGPCAAPSLADSLSKDAFVTKLSPAGAILYSTYLGGTGYEEANGIAVNGIGEIFVVGQTTSTNNYSLNFTGCSFDQGLFANFGFPVTATALAGAVNEELGVNKGFLTKIAPNGTLAYSTYLGILRTDPNGPGRFNPFVVATGVAVDAAGTAYISGYTRDPEFGGGCRNCNTTSNANAYDAFAMKLNPLVSGSAGLGYLRVFGGTAEDIGSGIAIDAGGSAHIAGATRVNVNVSTADPGFPTTPGAFQTVRAFSSPGVVETDDCGFVTKLGPTGSTTYSSLLCAGPRNQATITAIAVHQASGTAIVTGSAHSTLPLVSPVATNVPTGIGAFVTRFNAAGSALLFSSFLAPAVANDNQAVGNAIAVDSDLNAYIAGVSPDQLTMSTLNAYSAGKIGLDDAFLAKVNVSQPPPTSMTIASGSPQAATAGTNFTTPFQVLLRDANGQPSPGINVTFSGLGSTVTVSTDAQGLATAPQFTANAVAGAYTLFAAAFNLTTVNLNVYSLPVGATISAAAGAGQSIPAGLAFGTTLQALVRNAASVPLAGVPVTFSAPASGAGATFAGATTVLTNASGIATAPALTSNSTQGTYNATANVTSLPAVTTNFNLTNLPPNLTPTVGTLSPGFANTAQQTMVFTFSDSNGFADLNVINVLVNTALDARNACYIAYVRGANLLYLVADNGGLLGPITLGTTGSVGNNQCSIAAAGSSAIGSANSLTLTLNTTFTSAFGGRKLIYAAARDANLANSGWRVVGVNSVPPLPATSPAVGGSNVGQFTSPNQTGTFTFTSNAGFADLGVLNVLINTALDGRNACYFAYVRSANVFYLVEDIGIGLSGPLTPGTAQSITNSQCTINGTGTSAVLAGNSVTLTVNYTMKTPAFSGPKGVWAASRTNGDAANSGWQIIASWLLP